MMEANEADAFDTADEAPRSSFFSLRRKTKHKNAGPPSETSARDASGDDHATSTINEEIPSEIATLTNQLSAVMANKRQQRTVQRSPEDCEFLTEELPRFPPPLPPSPRSSTSASNESESVDSEEEPEGGTEHGVISTPEDITTKPWIKNARRKRWTSTLSYLGAWVLTVGIGGFIIATAAIVVLGPQQFLEKSNEFWNVTSQPLAKIEAPKPNVAAVKSANSRTVSSKISIVEAIPKPFAVSEGGKIARAPADPDTK